MTFIKLGEWSIVSTALIMIVLCLRRCSKSRISYKVIILLWQLVLLRLLIPISVLDKSKGIRLWRDLALDNLQEHTFMMRLVRELETATYIPVITFNTISIGKGSIDQFLLIIWLFGIFITASFWGTCFYKSNHIVQQAIPITGKMDVKQWLDHQRIKVTILLSDCISTPIAAGILKHKIILPSYIEFSEQELEYILTHESIHIRKQHILWKYLALVVICIHWFNPFVWLMYRLLCKDIEIACDEQVISELGNKEREQYALSLITLAAQTKSMWTVENGFGKNDIEERVKFIMRKNKRSKKVAILIVGLGIMSTSVSATTMGVKNHRIKQENNEKSSYAVNNQKANYNSLGVAYNESNNTWELNGIVINLLIDGDQHKYFNNSDDALENGLSLKVVRNEENQIVGIEELTKEEISNLRKSDSFIDKVLKARE